MFMYLNFEQASSVKIKIRVQTCPKISLIRLIFLGKINMQNLDCSNLRFAYAPPPLKSRSKQGQYYICIHVKLSEKVRLVLYFLFIQ